ncbi:MAG TPA: Clp protease N-terminal domain-containing protein, partial [Streptosporangiaceae bacterium]
MFERFTDPAREAVIQAQQYSRNLGHPFIGTEHLLLGVVAVDDPASALLRDHGLTPEKVQAALLRLTRTADEGPATRMFGGLDRDALASIGIDLDEVRTRIEASFGPGALTRAALNRPQRRHLLGRRRRARGRTGPANQTGPVRGRVPFTRRAK